MLSDVPHTYCWSPYLIPRPHDWSSHIDVCGFFFLPPTTGYQPPKQLLDFLSRDSKPLYIGLGSICGHNQPRLLRVILAALKNTGHRVVICRKLATPEVDLSEKIFRLGECPHDWLFRHGRQKLTYGLTISAHKIA